MSPMEEQQKQRKRHKPAQLNAAELKEAERLHGLLFGTLENVAEDLGKEAGDLRADVLEEENAADDLYIIDSGRQEKEINPVKKPVWVDEAEEEIEVRVNKQVKSVPGEEYVAELRARHAKVNPRTDWAALPSEKKRKHHVSDSDDSDVEDAEGDEEENEFLKQNDELVVKSKGRLPQGSVEVTRMTNANAEEPSKAVIRSVEFHRNGQLLMTAGYDKKLRFFQIDGKKNPKIQTVFLENFPVHNASFTPDGSKVVATSRRKSYVTYDLLHGKVETAFPLIGREERSLEKFVVSPDNKLVAFGGNEGYILLTSLATKQLVGTLKMNGSVRSFDFTSDGRQLLSCGGDGEVYCWDMSKRRCIFKGSDDGCIRNTSLCVSPNNEYFCTGSSSGVVNVYEREKFLNGSTAPVKSLFNLTTAVDRMSFNHDSQMLAMSSSMKKEALKLVHVPSFTVFSNWPTQKTPLQYVHSLDFSPGSGYLAAGNGSGTVLLYRLRHYDHA